MSHEFDFNIDNYSIDELEHFIKLDETSSYTFNELHSKCAALRGIIVESPSYDKSYKSRLSHFIEEAEAKLVEHLRNMTEGKDGFIEDYNKLVIAQDEGHVINQTTVTNNNVMLTETTSLNNVVNPHKRFQPMESFPTLVARSYLNNLKRKLILQTVILNTLFRENYYGTTSTDFTIVLPYYFKNVVSLRLSSVQLPNVIYNVSAYNGNNNFTVEEDITGIVGTIVIPDGSYTNIATFTTMLQTEINQQLGIAPPRFLVTYDPNSNKITISNATSNFTLLFNESVPTINGKCAGTTYTPTEGQREQNCVELNELYKQFGWLIGYRQPIYSNDNTYTTEAVFNGLYPNYVYFVLNDFNNSQAQNVFGMFSKSIIGDNILGVLPITATQPYSINFTTGNDLLERKRDYFGPVRIQRLKVQIVNQFGDVVDLNNMDYSFSLELEIGYDI